MIEKKDLVHGAYYEGHCRNADVARWNADIQKFKYRRFKFGGWFIEEICHPDDDQHYDVFVPEKECSPPEQGIPL